ncbi:carotenoid oxygenase family protein [Nonomuraea sp. KC401]|uniref:carotenoid oxygenase family protein n=1 Tax=unclassified Nonomuraea TaxID=2593643 RepID=UPI0010FE47EC|nr:MULTISPECIES: carotenoid oxygenase family protein [unclassified Nonomuraea]NBE95273.1 carotenoid oxygenase [Nonomuraea sp. K271]TLF72371.1 carotenoid oxygenase family protein [Nonomuraea sp. KC401]
MPPTNASAPVTEEVTAYDLPVSGTLPPELNGRYLRNGPNALGLDDPGASSLFLGTGMVHGVRLRDGRAEWYRNRWVRSAMVAQALGEQPRRGPVFEGMDFASNTHVIGHAGRTLALVESGPRPYELSDDLETVGPFDFGGTLPAGYAAHTKLDPRTGELHAITYRWGRPDAVEHIVVGADALVSSAREVPVTGGPMMHDFALTGKYVILYDLPVIASTDAAGGSMVPYAWDGTHGARLGLLPRDGSGVRWLDIEPCWIYHTLNAYDDGDRVVIDVIRYPQAFDMAKFEGTGTPTLDRFTVDLTGGKVAEQRLHDRAQEFPRVDERVVSAPHRYGYTAVSTTVPAGVEDLQDLDDDAFGSVLLKHDLVRGTVETHGFGRDAAVGEAVFVPSSAGAAEDDGYVMAFVHDPDRGASDLVILAAQDFTGAPIATVHLPVRVPLGFHGSWIPSGDLS